MNRKLETLALCVVIVAAIAICVLSQRPGHRWGDDWAQYLGQTRGLVDGTLEDFIADARFRNAHSTRPFGPVAASWGYPLLLTPVYAVAGMNLAALKWVGTLLFAGFLLTLHALFEPRLGALRSLLLVSIFAFNPYLIDASDQLLTDLPFLFFASQGLLQIDRFVLERRYWSSEVFSQCLLGLTLSFACLTRSVGVLLVATSLACHAIAWWRAGRPAPFAYLRAQRAALLCYGVLAGSIVLGALLLPRVELEVGTHIDYLADSGWTEIPRRILQHAQVYAVMPTDFFASLRVPGLSTTLYVCTIPFAIIGLLRRHRVDTVFVVWCALVLGVLLVSQVTDGLRYLFPVLPFYLYFAFASAGDAQVSSKAWPALAVTALGAVIAAAFLLHSVSTWSEPWRNQPRRGPYSLNAAKMLDFIADGTPDEAVIAFFKPRALTLMTGRRAIMVNDPSQVFDGRADFVIIIKARAKDQVPLREPLWNQQRSRYRISYQNPEFVVMEVLPKPG